MQLKLFVLLIKNLAVAPGADESSSAAGPASAFDNPEARPLAERCLLGFGSTSGPPTMPNYFYTNLKQIVQPPTTVTIVKTSCKRFSFVASPAGPP